MVRRVQLMRVNHWVLALVLVLTACADQNGERPEPREPFFVQDPPRFELELIREEYEAEISGVWLVAGERRIFVAEAAGAMITASPHAPADAVASLMAWWAGGGPQFYATNDGAGTISIYQGWEDETRSAEEPFTWDLIRTIDLGEPPSRLAAGKYCYSWQVDATSMSMTLEVSPDGSVTGFQEVHVADHENDYYRDTLSEVSGRAGESVLRLTLRAQSDSAVHEMDLMWGLDLGGVWVDGHLATPCELAISHCAASERTFFSCPLEDSGEIASLCGSVIQRESEGYLQFRTGMEGETPRVFPPDLTGSTTEFQWESLMYSGGWDTRVQFVEDGTAYQLFDRAIKVSMSEKDFSAGVITVQEGQEDLVRECLATELESVFLNAVPGVIEMGSFIDLDP
ncbi:hypothetical protein JYT20_00245 [Rhodothermus sp. AH-315-K08]|nr:hypothetical protein [Rhodothermus sp. AH-315-K08]